MVDNVPLSTPMNFLPTHTQLCFLNNPLILSIMSTKITFEDWIDIFATTLEEFAKRFSDDGKLSVADGISIFMVLLRAISSAAKNSQ